MNYDRDSNKMEVFSYNSTGDAHYLDEMLTLS